jgi:hypothetical protein
MNICRMESRGFTSCGMGVGSGPNPVYSPEILFRPFDWHSFSTETRSHGE